MSAPPHVAKIFYECLIGRPDPSDTGAEQRVLGAILGSGDAMAQAAKFLVPEDFTDPVASETFRQQVAGFTAAGGVPANITSGSPLVEDMRRVRQQHSRRVVEKLAWELAYAACKTDDPEHWCLKALERIQRAAGRINASMTKCEPERMEG